MKSTAPRGPVSPPRHYPYVTRMLLDLYHRGELTRVVDVAVEPEYGYATRITYASGNVRTTFGNDLGLNPGAACDLATDKAYTKFFLDRDGIRCPRGAAFLLPWWAERIRSGRTRHITDMRLATDAPAYAEQLGLPVYVKPVHGSKGAGVFRCDTPAQVRAALAAYAATRVRVALVEEAVDLPDYRLVVLRGELISAYLRTPLTVVGDGRATVIQLAVALQEQFEATGRDSALDLDDPRIEICLVRNGLSRDTVVAAGRRVMLHDISNLSTGGTAHDVTDVVAPRWKALAAGVATRFGLTLAGLDLACADIREDAAEHSVLEINAAPGLDHYAAAGDRQQQIVRDLYAKVLNLDPGRPK